MVDLVRRARLIREMEEEFVPDYDAASMPSADKRAAYALEHIAFRVGTDRANAGQDRRGDRGRAASLSLRAF